MTDTDHWLNRYEGNLGGIASKPLYWLSVPLLLAGLIGLLWALPVPRELTQISPLLNWGSLFLMAALTYYFIISVPLAIGMIPVIMVIFAFELWLQGRGAVSRPGAAMLTVAGLAGLYIAHRRDGGLQAVFRDVQLLMIAPLWALSRLYRKLGIPS